MATPSYYSGTSHGLKLLWGLLFIGGWLLLTHDKPLMYCRPGFAVYQSKPIPYFDFIVGTNEEADIRARFKELAWKDVEPLVNENPAVIIIAMGWEKSLEVPQNIVGDAPMPVYLLSTGEAVEQYNQLREEGQKVALIYHSGK